MMNRYSRIENNFPREFLLLQGLGCKWRKCTFCNYYEDASTSAYETNRPILEQVTGEFGVLDIINSGSAMELDSQTIALIKEVVKRKHIHTLWFEAHYMYRNRLDAFAAQFPGITVKFRCGVETFDGALRQQWNKGMTASVTPEQIAEKFHGVCLLCCTEGETRERILADIATADRLFEYFSVNVFCNNSTPVKRDEELAKWFANEVYPKIKDNPKIEVLIDNTDLGVGGS